MELAPYARQREFSSSGVPLAGGKLYSYEAGTTTLKATYQDRSGTPNTNPIILDSEGRYDLWLDSGYYKFVLKDSLDNIIWTKDQVSLPDEAALASAFWRDVVYVTSADSPLTLTQTHNGKLLSVDASGGAVVINLPQISLTSLPYNLGFKLSNATNAVTINRAGTDTIEGATSKTINTTNGSCQLIADIDKSPDQWATLDFGVVDFSGYPIATPEAADFVPIVDTSASSVNKKATFASFRNAVYRSVTTTDSVGTDDETMKLSGASFTSTLPTAVGVAGKRYKFVHAGTSLTQVYTLATTLAQTIGGIVSGSYALYTNGEVLGIESDGANWIIVNHKATLGWIDAGANTITGTTSAPAKGTTSRDKFFWSRSGPTMFCRIEYLQSASSAGAGSGDYLFLVPATIDTAVAGIYSFVGGAPSQQSIVGVSILSNNASSGPSGNVAVYDSTHVRLTGGNTFGFASSSYYSTTGTAIAYAARFEVPISGWQP